jgi:hypothetical protein
MSLPVNSNGTRIPERCSGSINPDDFILWLDGFLSNSQSFLNESQTDILKSKIGKVFHKVTPNYLDGKNKTFEEIMTGQKIQGYHHNDWDVPRSGSCHGLAPVCNNPIYFHDIPFPC